MKIFHFYIFNRKNECLFYRAWDREEVSQSLDSETKNIAGLLYTLRQLLNELSPKESARFESFATDTYRLHYLKPLSGFSFLLFTEPGARSLQTQLKHIYKDIFIELVIKNPLYTVGDKIELESFRNTLDDYISETKKLKEI